MDELEKQGFETEHLQIYDEAMTPCNSCLSCRLRGDGRCINEDDRFNDYLDSLYEADAIVLASPVYYGSVTAQMKILMERAGLCSRYAGNRLSRKVGAALVVQGRKGGLFTHSELVNFMLESQMIVCPSSGTAVLTASGPKDLEDDEENIRLIKDLAKELAWLLGRLKS